MYNIDGDVMKKLILILIILCICGCTNHNQIGDNTYNHSITGEEVFHLIDSTDVIIVDVRESYEYKNGHIKNAYNIPLAKLDSISDFDFSKKQKIIVYCQSGNRSKMALEKLSDMGYINVYDMGGIQSWEYELITE